MLHISDEMKKARLKLPRSMIISMVLNTSMQLLYLVTVLFTIGDVNVVSSGPLPILQVYYQATDSRLATNFFVSMLGMIFTLALFNIFASYPDYYGLFSGIMASRSQLPSHIFTELPSYR